MITSESLAMLYLTSYISHQITIALRRRYLSHGCCLMLLSSNTYVRLGKSNNTNRMISKVGLISNIKYKFFNKCRSEGGNVFEMS